MKLGNKASSLVKMQALGVPVPAFFSLTTDHFLLFQQADGKRSLPKAVANFLDDQLPQPMTDAWAVRSSSTKEDGQSLSFAGLFETFLNLRTREEIEDAILKCWESTHSARVKKYAEKNGIRLQDIEMAVVIQKFIEPDYAGVLFTAHPTTGRDSEMYIEMCKGRGENLVSGHVTPSHWEISWKSPLRILRHQANEDLSVPDIIFEQLQHYGQLLQSQMGTPQDIEFLVKDSTLYFVQSRPITKLQFANNDEEWTTADFRDGGVSSDVVSPLMWSLYDKIFSASLPEYFYKIKLIDRKTIESTKWFDVVYARPYWNLKAVKDIMSQVPDFNELNFDQDMSIPITYEGPGRVTPFTIMGLIKVLPAVFGLESEFRRQLKRSQDLTREFSKIENYYLKMNLTSLDDAALLNQFKKLVIEDYTFIESEYFQTIYNASNAKMEFLSALKHLQKIDSSLEYIHLISDLGELEATLPATQIRDIASRHGGIDIAANIKKILSGKSGPVQMTDIMSLSQPLQKEISVFIQRFYYHSERELDLRVPRWQEDLRFILNTLVQILEAKLTLKPNLRTKIYEIEHLRLRTAYQKSSQRWIPGWWRGLQKKLTRVREFLRLREEIRCHSTKMYFFIRQMALEIAQRKLPAHQRDLIFYASYQQVIELQSEALNVDSFVCLAQETERYAQGYRLYQNPNEIGYRYNFIGQKITTSSDSKSRLKGIGCSAGIIRGKARVISNISEATTLQAGEILVTRFTDPGWTPLFSLASGVVCENGGLLSHAALISREYGIPSVLNVREATHRIQTGQEIELDGMKGEISIL